jgi:type IV pilus assembly protein PilO
MIDLKKKIEFKDLKAALSKPIRMPEFNERQLYIAAAALIAALNIFLLIRLGGSLNEMHRASASNLHQRQLQIKATELEIAPMRGMDDKLAQAQADTEQFYATRLPAAYSTIAAELGKLANESTVRQTRAAYAPKEAGDLTEVRMEATLVGDYTSLMRYINAMERDKIFFVIRGVTLSGQQGGTVNLRLRMDTYLRPGGPAEGVPATMPTEPDKSDKADQSAAANPEADDSTPAATHAAAPAATPATTPAAKGKVR